MQRWPTPTPELTFFYSELILFIRDGVGVELELELTLFSNSDSTPIDLMTSKKTTKKLRRCPQRWATPTPELKLTPELTLFYSDLELVLLTLELELEWSFENIDGVGVAYPRSCPSLIIWIILFQWECFYPHQRTEHD